MAVLGIGSTGDEVKHLQTQLTNSGFDPGRIDGIYGEKTAGAVKAYQVANGLSADSIAGVQTLGSLSQYSTTLKSQPAQAGVTVTPAATDNTTAIATSGQDFTKAITSNAAGGVIIPVDLTESQKQGFIELAQTGEYEFYNDPVNGNLQARLKTTTSQPNDATTEQTGSTDAGSGTPQGGSDIPSFNPPQQAIYQSPYADQLKGILDEMINAKPYDSPYAAQIQALINQITSRKFSYDPATDMQYQQASKQLSRQVMELMNQRGILNSTITENQIQQGISELLPQYQSQAYDRYMQEGEYLFKQANLIMGVDESGYNRYVDEQDRKYKLADFINGLDDKQFQMYKDARDTEYNRYLDEYNAAIKTYEVKQQKIKTAWDRVNELGYVDNETSITLGVPVGTLSKAERERLIARKEELEDAKTALVNEAKTKETDYQYQLKLDASRAATAAEVKAQEDKWNNAIDLWRYAGIADAYISKILGVPLGAKTADYQISSINAETSRQNANTAKAKAEDTATTEDLNTAERALFDDFKSQIEKTFVDYNMGAGKYVYPLSEATLGKIAEYLNSLSTQGFSEKVLKQLGLYYGFDMSEE